jgi:type I restriction enzyme S subunit
MALLRVKDRRVAGAFLLHAYLSQEFQNEIRKRAIYGATVDRIPLRELPSWPIPMPPEDNWQQLSDVLGSLQKSVVQTTAENRALAALRDALLPQLISGKLRVRDAERIVEDAV